MEPMLYVIITSMCLIMAMVGIIKSPIISFFGMLIATSVLLMDLSSGVVVDASLRMFMLATTVICLIAGIVGYNK